MTQREQDFQMKGCSKFVFPNSSALGYYRYNYDSAALQAMGSSVEKSLTPEERISLMGNEWALMEIGKHNVGEYLALGAQLKNTPGAVLLASFGRHMNFINQHMLTDGDRSTFQAWLRTQFSPVLQQLGYDARPNDTPEDKQKRALLFEGLGNMGEDPQVIQQAQIMVQELMKDPTSVDGTLAPAVVAVAARHGNAELYNQFRAQLQKASSPEQYYMFARALGQFPEQSLIQQTLATTLTPAVRGQDLYMLLPMMANPCQPGCDLGLHAQELRPAACQGGRRLGRRRSLPLRRGHFLQHREGGRSEAVLPAASLPRHRAQSEGSAGIHRRCIQLRDQQQNNLAAWLKQQGTSVNAVGGSGGGGTVSGATMR